MIPDLTVLSPDERDALFQPTGLAHGIPGRTYYDPAIYERERDTLFAQSWIGAAFLSDIPNPGDVMPLSFLGRELIFVRGKDMKVRCFYNICRHRGMQLVAKPGQSRDLRCPYHSWVFDLEGKLIGTPAICGIGKHQAEGFSREDLGLREVRSEVWFDVIFINLDGQAAPFQEYIEPVRQRLEPVFDFSLVQPSDDLIVREYPVNWKIVLEGGIEDYHLPYVHEALRHSPTYTPEMHENVYGGFSDQRPLDKISRRFLDSDTDSAVRTFPIWPEMQRSGLGKGCTLFVFPSVTVTCDVNIVKVNITLPLGPELTETRLRAYFLEDAATAPEYERARAHWRQFWNSVLAEDDEIWTRMQAAARTRHESDIESRFSPHWEKPLHAFQRYWAAGIEGAAR